MIDNYGVFKHQSMFNHYNSITKSVNSVIATEFTQKSLKRITPESIVYGHMGQMVIKDGICYTSFIQNPGNDGEAHFSGTSEIVLAFFPLERALADDFNIESDIAVRRIGGSGDSFAGRRAMSIYKDNSMCIVGDKIFICFSFITDDCKTRLFSAVYDIESDSFGEEKEIKLSYRDKVYDFTDQTIDKIYEDNMLERRAKGMIEIVSSWNEYNGEYYATGIFSDTANNGFVVKTSDFSMFTLVDVLAFNDMGSAEIASYIYKNRLYVACRQHYGIPYMYINYYDLERKMWGMPYKIADGNVRPWFFEYKGELYLLNTIDEYNRLYTNISKVRTLQDEYRNYNYHTPVESLFTLKDCGAYFAVCNYNDRIFFVSTKDTISFGEINMQLKSEDEVNGKLLELFGV